MNDHNEQTRNDNEAAVAILRRYSAGKALRPPVYPNKTVISVKISEHAKQRLEQIAKDLGYIYAGHGNVSMLIEAIGTDTVDIVPKLL